MNEAKRNCTRVTECGEEAWSKTASRWTRTGYEGGSGQGERANDRKALVANVLKRKFGDCAVKDRVLTWGDPTLRLKGRRQ